MRNMLAFLAALVLTIVGVGLYLDWFKFRTATPNPGHRTVNIEVNTDKITDDLRDGGEYILEQGGEKIHEILEKHRKNDTPQADNTSRTPVPPMPPQ